MTLTGSLRFQKKKKKPSYLFPCLVAMLLINLSLTAWQPFKQRHSNLQERRFTPETRIEKCSNKIKRLFLTRRRAQSPGGVPP